ncbi:MAG: tripartite tricarboxylate transporter permease, partial [Euryarchaeota archaeon]|nr:tripartite tricarboxylate transporter permease [Euryarchaeota archaeon]
PGLLPLLPQDPSGELAPLLLAVVILSAALAETFVDFIPSAFLGAPDEDTALSLLPGHAMLLEGRGYEAVALSAIGSLGALLLGLALLLPFRLLLGEPIGGYAILRQGMLWVLLAIVVLLLLTDYDRWEPRRFPRAIGLFLLSGILGLAALDMEMPSPLGLPGSPLFPLLTGLFGLSTLLTSAARPGEVPPQSLEGPRVSPGEAARGWLPGTLSGALMAILPGVTSAQATVLALLSRRNREPRQVVLTLSAVNTANALFVVGGYFILLRPRSGALAAISPLVPPEPWVGLEMPGALSSFLLALVAAGVLAYLLTLLLGRRLAPMLTRVPYRKLSVALAGFLVLLVFLFTGPIGLVALAGATAVGLLGVRSSVRRTHMMGVLLLPILLRLAQ